MTGQPSQHCWQHINDRRSNYITQTTAASRPDRPTGQAIRQSSCVVRCWPCLGSQWVPARHNFLLSGTQLHARRTTHSHSLFICILFFKNQFSSDLNDQTSTTTQKFSCFTQQLLSLYFRNTPTYPAGKREINFLIFNIVQNLKSFLFNISKLYWFL